MNTKQASTKTIITFALLPVLALLASSCKPQTDDNNPDSTPSSGLHALFVTDRPEGAIPVAQARSVQPGDPIVVTGVIGGALRPFTEGYASFILADDAIVFCNEMEDDHCDTPWDACCEDRDKLRRMRLVVQALDDQGLPFQQGFRGVGGLKELDEVTVSGVVDPQSTPDNLIVNLISIVRG